MTRVSDQFNVFRRLDAGRLVIFERRGILMQQRNEADAPSLMDIDETVLQILQRLRDRGFCFGFISDQRGIKEGEADHRSASVLINLLDGILTAYGASPHFWLAWASPPGPRPLSASPQPKSPDASLMIARILDHYGVDISTCAFVGKSRAGLAAAAGLGLEALDYPAIAERTNRKLGTADFIALQIMRLTEPCTGRKSVTKAASTGGSY